MEYLLPAAFTVGLLLFILSWLRVVIAGFGHHFVTGIVSVIPVLNLLILPGIWHKVYAWVFAGIIGLLVAVASWYAGADKHVYRYASDSGVSLPAAGEGQLNTTGVTIDTDTTISSSSDTPAAPLAPGKELPKTALFRLTYQKINNENLGQYIGNYVRITRTDRKTFEGKVLGATEKSVVIERRTHGGVIEQNLQFTDISQAEVMNKQ